MVKKENKSPCIGIDVSKGESHFQSFESAGSKLSSVFKILHTKEGFKVLLDEVKRVTDLTGKEPILVFEDTGTYSRLLETLCKDNNISYSCIPPLLSAKTRKANIRPTKTDAIDCATIANAYYIHRLPATKPQSKLVQKLKTLCSYYNFKSGITSKNKIKYRELVDQVYPRIDCYVDVTCNAIMKMISKYPNPHKLKRKSIKELNEFFAKIPYTGSVKSTSFAIVIKQYFKDVEIAVKEDDQLITLLAVQTKDLLEELDKNDEMLKQIINLGMKTEEYKYLISIPGFQKNSAARVAAEVSSIDRFASASKLIAYIGIDPVVSSSGKYTGEHLGITKKGNRRLRCLLYLVVVGTCRSTLQYNPIRDFVNKKKSDGLSPKAAYIAGCNKLARIIYATCSKREYFNNNSI